MISWWVGLDRSQLAQQLALELPRIEASKIGQWERICHYEYYEPPRKAPPSAYTYAVEQRRLEV